MHGSGRQVTHCSGGAHTRSRCARLGGKIRFTLFTSAICKKRPSRFGPWGDRSQFVLLGSGVERIEQSEAVEEERRISVAAIHAHVLGTYGGQ